VPPYAPIGASMGAGSSRPWPRTSTDPGNPRRAFFHVDDLADACVFPMRRWESPDIVNVGVAEDVSIAELAELVRAHRAPRGDRGDVRVVSRERRRGVAVDGLGNFLPGPPHHPIAVHDGNVTPSARDPALIAYGRMYILYAVSRPIRMGGSQ